MTVLSSGDSRLDAPALPGSLRKSADSDWLASIELAFQHGARGTRLVHCRHQGPLYVQKPFYPEGRDLAHVYLLHPPGGLVSGDRLTVNLELAHNSRVLLTTPGAGRVYRARESGRLQHQHFSAKLGQAAMLEYMPQEMIVFPGAQARVDTRFELTENSRLIAWDICSLGLPMSDMPFSSGDLCLRFGVYRDGVPVLLDHQWAGDRSRSVLHSRIGWQGYPVGALMVAGPFAEPSRQLLEDTLSALRTRLTAVSDDGL